MTGRATAPPAGDCRLWGEGEKLSKGPLLALWCGRSGYDNAIDLMMHYHEKRRSGEIEDVVLYLDHDPVITFGRATPREHIAAVPELIPCREVNRGGLATYHGPGQLVGYTLVDLVAVSAPEKPDLHKFLRALENGIANYLQDAWELPASTLTGKTGVWIVDAHEPRKICSMGIAVRKWVTYHGFALNVSNDLKPFSYIVPCGLEGVTMTSVKSELQRRSQPFTALTLRDIAAQLHPHIVDAMHQQGFHFHGEKTADDK